MCIRDSAGSHPDLDARSDCNPGADSYPAAHGNTAADVDAGTHADA